MKNETSKQKFLSGESMDYEMFLPVLGNRKVRQKHITKLVESIRAHGNNSALICREVEKDGKMYCEVRDGQHRLEALKILKMPVKFTLHEITDEGMIALNEDQLNWELEDYLNFYVTRGKTDYILLNKYKNDTGLSIASLIELFGEREEATPFSKNKANYSLSGTRHGKFRNGKWKIDSASTGEKIIEMISDFYIKYGVKHYKMARFISAFIVVSESPNYSHEKMLKQMDKCASYMRKQPNKIEYIKNFEVVYNYQVSGINKVTFTKHD